MDAARPPAVDAAKTSSGGDQELDWTRDLVMMDSARPAAIRLLRELPDSHRPAVLAKLYEMTIDDQNAFCKLSADLHLGEVTTITQLLSPIVEFSLAQLEEYRSGRGNFPSYSMQFLQMEPPPGVPLTSVEASLRRRDDKRGAPGTATAASPGHAPVVSDGGGNRGGGNSWVPELESFANEELARLRRRVASDPVSLFDERTVAQQLSARLGQQKDDDLRLLMSPERVDSLTTEHLARTAGKVDKNRGVSADIAALRSMKCPVPTCQHTLATYDEYVAHALAEHRNQLVRCTHCPRFFFTMHELCRHHWENHSFLLV